MRIHAKSSPLCCPTLSIASTFCLLNKTGGLLLVCFFYLQQGLIVPGRLGLLVMDTSGWFYEIVMVDNELMLTNVIWQMSFQVSVCAPFYRWVVSPPPNANCMFVRSSESSPHFDFLPLPLRHSFQPFFVFSVSYKTSMYCLIIVMILLAAVFPAWEPW